MASELLKNKTLIQRLKEDKVPVFNFDLAGSALDYNIESIEEELLPKEKPQELFDERDRLQIESLEQSLQDNKPFLMDESVDFIEREELKFGGTPLTEEQVQAILDSYNNYKKQKGALPNLTNVVDNFTAEQKKILGKSGNIYRVKKVLKENKLKYNPKPSAEKRKAADEVRVQKVKEQKNPFLTDKKLEEKFIKDVEKRYSYPFNSSAAKEAGVLTDKEMMKKYGFGNRKLNRYIAEYRDKLNLSYPKQTYEGEKAVTEDRLKRKKDLRKEISGFKEEQKITDIKRPFDTGRKSYKGIDLAHKASLEQFKDLGLEYGVTNLGLDKQKLNQQIIRPTEEKMESLHKQRMELIKNVEAGKVPKDIQKQLEQINIKMSNLSMGSKGMLQAVLIDEKTLKPFVFNKDYSRIIGQGLIDKPVKELTKAELDLIKVQMPELVKTTKRKLNLDLDKKSRVVNIPMQESGQKKLTALQQLASGKNVGFDPILATRAGFEEFVKPAAKIGARGAATLADLAISAGPGAKGLGLGLLLEADPIITGMSEGKTFGQTARDTFVGSAIDAIPGVNLGSLNEDLMKLADTEEQRVGVQNVIDYQTDADRFKKRFENYKYLEDNPFEAEGIDLIAMEKSLLNDYLDLQSRKPKVQNSDVFSLLKGLARKEAIKRKENLESDFQGFFFGDRPAKDPNFIDNQIQQILAASTGVQGATDSYADNYRFLPQEQLTSDELDERFDMEGGIMAANGGRIGFADGPMDPKRRLFLKIMGGIASLPVFGKFLGKSEVAKPIVKVAGSSTRMPDWFPDLINKAMFSSTGKRVDADLTVYEPKELPGVSIGRYDDGRVFVEGKNEYGKRYEIEYEPPGYELIDEKTGKAVKKPGEFIAKEEVPVNVDPDGNADFDVEVLDDLDQILGPDTRAMEEFATGKNIKDMKSGEFQVGKAEADADRAIEEAAELDEID